MMKLSCKDLDPAMNCDFEATGNSAGEVAGKMMVHVKKDHPNEVKGMPDGDVMSIFKSKAHN